MTTARNEIAVCYDSKMDGFLKLVLKHVRNPEHPAVVWMLKVTWEQLATCATSDGDFFIPCKKGLQDSADLRALVFQMERA